MAGTNPILPPANDDEVRFDPAVIGGQVDALQTQVDNISTGTVVNNIYYDSFITPYVPDNKWLAPALYNISNNSTSVYIGFNAQL